MGDRKHATVHVTGEAAPVIAEIVRDAMLRHAEVELHYGVIASSVVPASARYSVHVVEGETGAVVEASLALWDAIGIDARYAAPEVLRARIETLREELRRPHDEPRRIAAEVRREIVRDIRDLRDRLQWAVRVMGIAESSHTAGVYAGIEAILDHVESDDIPF